MFRLAAFQHQTNCIHAKNFRNFAADVLQEILERHGIQHAQNSAVDLVGAGEVFIGGGDDRTMGVLQLVESRLKPVHRDATQIDDVGAHDLFVGRDQCTHHVLIVEDHIRARDYGFAQGVFDLGCACHILLGFLFF